MPKKRLKERIARSRWALPATLVMAAAVWVGAVLHDVSLLPAMVCTFAATLLMAELNNTHTLVRTYSRMASCTLLILLTTGITPQPQPTTGLTLQPQFQSAFTALCTVGCLTFLFPCYQNRRAAGCAFYAFLCLSLASTVWAQVLLFAPLLWLLMAAPLYCMSARTLAASFFGLLTPYWLAAGWFAATADLTPLITHFAELGNFTPIFSEILHSSLLTLHSSLLLTTVCLLLGAVHFWTTIHNDKIRVRALLHTLFIISAAALLLLALQPRHMAPLWGIMVVGAAPFAAHFIALTRGRWSAYTTYILMLAALAIIISNFSFLFPNFSFLI